MIGKIYNVVIMSKLLVTMIVLLLIGGGSTNWNFENTGLAKEHFDGNMYEYLKSDSYNWDSIRLIIEKAELVVLKLLRIICLPGRYYVTIFPKENILHKKGEMFIRLFLERVFGWGCFMKIMVML